MTIRSLIATLFISCGGAVLTMGSISLVGTYFDESRLVRSVLEVLVFPGLLFGNVFFPQGIHTGTGSTMYIYFFLLGNFIFYSLIWFLVYEICRRKLKHRRHNH